MYQRLQRLTAAEWCTWAACAGAVAGALLAIVVPAGGPNRVLGVALPFAIGAAVLAANALTWQRRTLGGILYAAAALVLLYGIVLALSVPLRLAVEGTCPLTTATCPLGFEHPVTGAENFAVYAATVCGVLALVLVFIAVEWRLLRRPGPQREQTGSPPS